MSDKVINLKNAVIEYDEDDKQEILSLIEKELPSHSNYSDIPCAMTELLQSFGIRIGFEVDGMAEDLSRQLCEMCGIENIDFTKPKNLEMLFKITNKKDYDKEEIKQAILKTKWEN